MDERAAVGQISHN